MRLLLSYICRISPSVVIIIIIIIITVAPTGAHGKSYNTDAVSIINRPPFFGNSRQNGRAFVYYIIIIQHDTRACNGIARIL